MKRILILLLGLFSVAYGQFAPTSAKSAFKWGISIGTRDSTAYAANDSLVVVINRQGRMMYRSTDGYWKLLANAASSDYVPYTGAVDNVALGNFRITARSVKTDSIYANGSGGMYLLTNSGNPVAHWGGGGSVEVDFKGFAGYDANRASSYTARSFTDKNYVDSSAGLRVRYTDTAAMLSNYRRKTTLIENSDLRNSAITINGSSTALGGSISVGTVTSVAASAGTGISVSGSPITSNGTLTITNTAPDQTVTLTAGTGISVSGTYPNFTVTNSSPSSGGTVTSVSAGTGMSFTTITSSGAVNADTTTLATRAYAAGLDVAKANTSLNNVNGVLSSTYGGAGSVSGILKANGSGVVSAATAADIPSLSSYYLPLSGGTLTGALNGTSLSMSGGGVFTGNVGIGVTPSAWDASSNVKVLQMNAGSLWGFSTTAFLMAQNSFSNTSGVRTYVNTGFASEYEQTSGQHIWRTAASGTAGNPITFTQAMTLTANSELLVNTTTTDGTNKLIVNGGVKGTSATFSSNITATDAVLTKNGDITIKFNPNNVAKWDLYYNNADGTIGFYDRVGSAFRMTLAQTGAATFSSSVTATGFFESSDLRLKNIVKRDGDVVYFNWKNGQDKKLHIGYIAQEVQKTNPDQVKADDKGFLSVNYTEVLVQKVRELEKQIAELQKRIK